jgi:hypothetical protein
LGFRVPEQASEVAGQVLAFVLSEQALQILEQHFGVFEQLSTAGRRLQPGEFVEAGG